MSGAPAEDGELEDGEICDDEAEESASTRGERSRPGGRAAPRPRKQHQLPNSRLPHPSHQPEFCLSMPYNLGPHDHGPFPPGHRPQCGPSGPDRPPSAPPLPLPPPAGLGPHCEPSPRSSFWERSHGTLGKFRHRVVPNGGRGAWCRSGRGGNRAPPGRYGPAEVHCSPSRKRILN